MNGRKGILAILLLILLLTAGCATMRVDVDVYKGPMSNHEDVQIEQMAVMAIGAKPVLLQLRDEFLVVDEGCVRPDSSNWVELKKNAKARRVNAILCLYENRAESLMDRYLSQAERLLERLEKTDSVNDPQAYRRLMSEMLSLALKVIVEVNQPRFKTLVDQQEVTRLATDVVVSIIKVGKFEKALKAANRRPGHQKQLFALTAQLASAPEFFSKKEVLRVWLEEKPFETVKMVRDVQHRVKIEDLVLMKPDGRPLIPMMKRRLVQLATTVSGLDFEKGRLDDGLETLVENYIDSRDGEDCIGVVCEEKLQRRRLRDALIRFAEKILFIANHRELFERSETAIDDGLDRYTLVLQAIGNSILNQADELTHSKAHQRRLEHQQESEYQALEQAAKVNTDYAVPPRGEKNQREVLDDLIAFLRYDLVLATRKGGDTGRAGQIEKALKLSLEHRASMIHIRPPSAYLRSSFAATGLQDESRIRWKNMLDERGFKASLPFGGGEKLVNKDDKYRIPILESIDKQYWQNINSVRVSGGGDTNYAIAKDDIGNWYVKSFSADPTPIIRGAQRMALFAAGGDSVNLLSRLDRQQALQKQIDNKLANGQDVTDDLEMQRQLEAEEPAGGSPALQRVFERNREVYVAATQEEFNDLRSKVGQGAGSLDKALSAAWEAEISFSGDVDGSRKADFVKKLNEKLAASNSFLINARQALHLSDDGSESAEKDKQVTDAQREKGIVVALKQLRRMHNALYAKVGAIDLIAAEPAHTEAVSNRTQAALDVSRIILGEVLAAAEKRRDNLKHYEDAVLIIGDAGE
ncbi:MAG: hypothetical protein OI74_05870 [Gammaproteobacteria bacterium (ex Lamellibrachia satsuma)]|nr:MAG: hypothetical protein HPY30_00340 [Gammaproteobacteria bacterium (ex Lamellibrachia satsuma)]RRS34081.1 MAG: hypothetical protein OI74_05870 [Gammaproteobacteria bacterium (ex Lamellibrachia satsuma)]RRS35162.1 MAG: hypothetical protein NV67_11380 [Gammaproteobacteria bacterium (ex Lamellibrachia satsuma)]